MPPFASKPGPFGVLYLYLVHYRDRNDHACPIFTWRTWAYDAAHAEERFTESDDDDGWTIVGDTTRQRAERSNAA